MCGTEMPFEGVSPLDHTADVGIEVCASDLAQLFHRAALGMTHLILEAGLPKPVEERAVGAAGSGEARLLRNWLRELLFLHEVEGLTYVGADFTHLTASRLEANVRLGRHREPPSREIKGVTLHGLRAERSEPGSWEARVIFDV